MRSIFSIFALSLLFILPCVAASETYCPDPNSIIIKNNHYTATTDAGEWVSDGPADQDFGPNPSIRLWQARAWPASRKDFYANPAKVNKFVCVYFVMPGGSAIGLRSPGYPARKFRVKINNSNTGWAFHADGYMICMSDYVSECGFEKI